VNKKMLALYGLKWNPFAPDVPVEALHVSRRIESFCWRVEQLVGEGGFALVTGAPGTGKSVTLRILADRLGGQRDVKIGILSRPQAGLADFYREMGDLFGVELAPHNRPGGNITGFASMEASLGGKWLELLSEIAPRLKRAAIMFHPDTAPVSTFMPSFETAARSLRVLLSTAPVHSDVEIEAAIIALARDPGGGLVFVPDAFTNVHRVPIISAAARNNIPAVHWVSAFARDGGLLSYGPADPVDSWRRAASYVDRILRGTKPADLPVQFPTKFELVVNLKTAKAIGLTIPESFLLRADEVIE
jgi:hypothetical protein